MSASTNEQRSDGAVGMWIFLVADAVSFAALLTAAAVLRVRPQSASATPTWLDVRLGAVLTYVLLASSLTMSLASGAASRGQARAARGWLWATIALGAAFVAGQGLEWSTLWAHDVAPATDTRAAAFFVCTGWHGAHVIAGLVALVAVAAFGRARAALPVAALFWHFLDAAWILVFTLVYLV